MIGSTFQIKPSKQAEEVGAMMDKLQAMPDGKPKGLKTINKIR